MLRDRIEADLARLPVVFDGDTSAVARMPEWKLINALADVADASGDVDAFCAAQQRLGPRVRDDAGMASRLIVAGLFAEVLAILDAALPNPAKSESALADVRITALDGLGAPQRGTVRLLAPAVEGAAAGSPVRLPTGRTI